MMPVGLRAWLRKHRTFDLREHVPRQATWQRKIPRARDHFETVLREQCERHLRIAEQKEKFLLQASAMPVDEFEEIVLAVHQWDAATEQGEKPIAGIDQRIDQRVGLASGRKNAAPAAIA
jgi:hypothetical protein